MCEFGCMFTHTHVCVEARVCTQYLSLLSTSFTDTGTLCLPPKLDHHTASGVALI